MHPVCGRLLALVAMAGGCGGSAMPADGAPVEGWRLDAADLDAAGTDARDPCDDETGCNPVSQAGCGPGRKCTVYQRKDGVECLIFCGAAGSQGVGEPCETPTGAAADTCVAGALCVPLEATEGTCRPFCSDGTCEVGTCTFLEELLGGSVGVCIE